MMMHVARLLGKTIEKIDCYGTDWQILFTDGTKLELSAGWGDGNCLAIDATYIDEDGQVYW